ncbi:SRPBCC family protein [Pseudorhodobacter sp. W20_MBD10_FR17]|uniref:SRPBCC family protein n=1 Tax=Pseudorhodobacter sp. W20_MBD10_FR17 TaxID=3240266 RepID=UPI003F966608
MKILVETTVNAPIERVWACWTTPADIVKWNTASDDWHTTAATVDLIVGGQFTSRMEAKDGSMGFDFAGEYTQIEAPRLIEAVFGGRALRVEFAQVAGGVLVREAFDAEDTHPVEMQKAGWQAILDRFKRYVESAVG